MLASPTARLRAGFAVARAAAATLLSRSRPEPPAPPAAAPPPRRLAHPCAVSVPVEATAEQVFTVLGDPARMPDWVLQHTGWIGQPPAEFAEGVRFRQRIKLMGVPSEVRWTVTGVLPEQAVWLEGTAPMGITVGFYLSVTPVNGGSMVRFDGGVEGGSADGPLGPMVARNLADAMRKSLDELGRVALTAQPVARTPRKVVKKTVSQAPVRWERTGAEIDPRTPVIVGVGQVSDRSTDPAGGDPVSLAARALRLAAEDSGAGPDLLREADLAGYVASVSWQYQDGAALLARMVGASPAETVQTTIFGGDGSLRLLNDVAAAIAEGRASIAVVGGAEAASTAAAAERAGRDLGWPTQPDGAEPTRVIGGDAPANNDPETAAGLVAPIYLYALIETAVRGRLGLSPQAHLERITRLWSAYSEVAAANPHAWQPTAYTPEELATPTSGNRMISAPYPKLLTANLQVNQGSGIIVCSAAAAQEAGIAQDRWVFVHAGAHATEEWYVTERADLATSPAIKAIGDAVLGHSGVTIDDVKHIDLYACFPSAVQIAALELGLPIDDPSRPLTVTGGLTFAGGPGNNYTSHAVANLVPLLRAEPESYGLATALGWYLTKHAATVLSARPPSTAFRDIDADPRLPRPPARRALREHSGPAVLEACTVVYERDGSPGPAIVTAITPAGDRVVLRLPELSEMSELLAETDPLGWQLDVTGATFTVTETTPVDLPPPGEPPLIVEWHGPVTVFRLNRPAVRNAIDLATARALEKAVDAFEADPLARVAVLTGSDTVFSAGMDLKAAARGEYPITEGRGLLGVTARPPTKPLIAAVEGAALAGGCELALAADLIVAAQDAAFGIPEVKRGLVAAAGGVLRLAQSLPRSTALELALTGEPMPARRLHELGLINRVTSPGKALDTALELAHDIAANAPLAVLLSKRIVDEHRDWGAADAFDHLSDIAAEVIGSADALEGIRAYAEHRPPSWKG
ncbi:crotonase/enoyl-CoA hydratase family protein [Actinoplanes sp. NEAU-A12]|uniref:Crotonase/enoyl-CoA hydratase family protein n=1 Tax=Actinoplanes sandaracinus TaxID=3045177 RepID=A0ABT6WPZ6_9ACTN|nr:crotonase/enoyl-CoA hydratase family protein [Actinoplanes sandaracinus]MDI6101779.1 crotonase/enoyl-CoA hydratase family protein [Actinoplanes sandaracinus]